MSGILRFAAPLDWAAGAPDVDEPAGRWLRARSSAPQVAGSVRGIRTDAVEARYRFPAGAEADDETPATRLEPGAAAKLRVAVPGVKSVVNPLPSFGGRGPEPTALFFDRSSTVLRHRNRAITLWDAERLVLHGFPEVALCRALPHHSHDSDCAPGWIAVVAVPDAAERLPVPTVLLGAQIETFLRERGTPHLQVAVLCPLYVEVAVSATVHLRRGLPGGAAIREVERHLRAFLHPLGLAPPGSEADAAALAELGPLPANGPRALGRPVYRSELVKAFEDHPAVDYVEDVVFGGALAGLERVDVDSCRGLVASALVHVLHPETSV
jgi:predicted phage baseplate assembly protein